VLVVCVNAVSGDTLAMLRRIATREPTKIVLVTNHVRDVDVLPLVECGVVGMVPIAAATPERLNQVASLQRNVLRPRV
jgi:DNA-binding NarL/FixJ family response regulator